MKSKILEEKDKIVEKEEPTYLEKSLVETSKTKIFKLLFLIFMIFEEIIFQFPDRIKEVKDLGFNTWSIVIWLSILLSVKIIKLYFFHLFIYVMILNMFGIIMKNPEGFDRLRYIRDKLKDK